MRMLSLPLHINFWDLSDPRLRKVRRGALFAIPFFKGLHLELDNIVFHFSDFGLSLDPVLHRELVFLPSKHLTVGVSGGIMSRPCKRPRLLQPGEISELVFDTDK